ncbi:MULTISPECIES: Rpn family recombination-promoting nuclease/putative transposase [unclassified Sphaerospermopsis]|uniref:Rpn family recombination-promoting nuclease/putative transposase n=1 Tax=unclassified Sphaerospermopsis TaxID=2646443 RepID=UPI001680D844|nr:Rpn family recombination-promoting nuclease/putative transposase [Sphaerospermopsis sp. FACHB-1094]MBD2147207.1 Rpn family recombination-promoting nuclease/putative transposase [Sphaerospermopsis sp. FACHB-1194]
MSVPIKEEWLEAFWCPQCQKKKWITQRSDLQVQDILNTEFQWIERESDVLLKVLSPEIGEFLLLNELQLRYNQKMPRRIRAYTALAEERYNLPVFMSSADTIQIYHRNNVHNILPDLKELLDICYPQPPQNVFYLLVEEYRRGFPVYIAIENSGKVIGFTYLAPNSKGGTLESLAVHPDPETRRKPQAFRHGDKSIT